MPFNLDTYSTDLSSLAIDCDQDDEMRHLIEYHPFFCKNDFNTYAIVYFHNKIDSLYQKGPTCGLLTLLLANQLVKCNTDESMKLDQLLDQARLLGLTKQGEMFSGNEYSD